jgi:hypothetical protein
VWWRPYLVLVGFALLLFAGRTLSIDSNAFVDQVQSLLDLGWDWWGSGQAVALDAEATFVGGVLHADQLTVWSFVGVRALLDQNTVGVVFGEVFQVARLFGDDVVAGFVSKGLQKSLIKALITWSRKPKDLLCLIAAILSLLFVVLQDGDLGGGLSLTCFAVVLWPGGYHHNNAKEYLKSKPKGMKSTNSKVGQLGQKWSTPQQSTLCSKSESPVTITKVMNRQLTTSYIEFTSP